MGFTELQPVAIHCDRCRRFGGVVLKMAGIPLLPHGWGYITRHDCGMTSYSTTDLHCDSCLLEAERAIAAFSDVGLSGVEGDAGTERKER